MLVTLEQAKVRIDPVEVIESTLEVRQLWLCAGLGGSYIARTA